MKSFLDKAHIYLAIIFFIVLAWAIFWPSPAHADPYLGLGASLAIYNVETNCPECSQYDVQKTTIKPALFGGYRYGDYAIEGGLGYSAYRGHAVMPSRPADNRQDIDARFIYLSGLRFLQLRSGEVYAGLGAAHLWASNYEHGLNRDTTTDVPAHQMFNHTFTSETKPIIQAGWQGEYIRIGVSMIPHAVVSHWTRSADLWNISFSWIIK